MSFWGDFWGKTQARDISNANEQAKGYLQGGYDEATGQARGYHDKAQSYLDPYAQSGRRAQSAYDDTLGLNGAEGGRNALTMYQNARNPYLDYEQNRAQRGIEASANARGGLGGGYTALAAARARQGLGYQDFNGWQSRLEGAAGRGAQIAGAQANMTDNFGRWIGDARLGLGQQYASNAINFGNALASTRNIGVNNLIGVIGAAGKAASAAMSGGKGGKGE